MTVVNLINVATITPVMAAGAVTASRVSIVDVAADKVAKINSLIIANIDGTNAANVTVEVSTDDGVTYVPIAKDVSVPSDESLVVVSKDSGFYLDETDILAVTASAAGDLTYLVSYELMTD